MNDEHQTEQARPQPIKYQPPRLEELGAWEQVTLVDIGSVPFNGLPGLKEQHGGF